MSFDLKIINGDLVIDKGDFKQVRDSEKLIQDILKVALTPVGSNPSATWYGSYVNRSLVGSSLEQNITIQLAQSQLSNAVDMLKTMQHEQLNLGQTVTPDEHIKYISDIIIRRNVIEPRLYDVVIKVISKGSKPVTTAFQLNTI